MKALRSANIRRPRSIVGGIGEDKRVPYRWAIHKSFDLWIIRVVAFNPRGTSVLFQAPLSIALSRMLLAAPLGRSGREEENSSLVFNCGLP